MLAPDNRYPNIILYAEYDERLNVRERIYLPSPQTKIILRKPIDLLSIELKSSGKIEEIEKKKLLVMLNDKTNVVEINYEVEDKAPLYSEWVIAPLTCYTIYATLRAPLPLKSLINAEEYGFHAWGKYGYSRWISNIPRREYALSIDEYLIMDEQTHVIASLDEKELDKLRIQVEQAYMKTKEIIPWKRPLIAHNTSIGTFISSYIVFLNNFSWENIVELIVKSIMANITGIPLENKLLESIRILVKREGEENMVENKNPYLGLIKVYGKDFLSRMLDEMLSSCPNNFKLILGKIFKKNVDIIISLLERNDAKISIENNSITCIKGPCIIVLEKEGIEYLKAILEEGISLKTSEEYIGRSTVYLF